MDDDPEESSGRTAEQETPEEEVAETPQDIEGDYPEAPYTDAGSGWGASSSPDEEVPYADQAAEGADASTGAEEIGEETFELDADSDDVLDELRAQFPDLQFELSG
jgi:hypothetical protein